MGLKAVLLVGMGGFFGSIGRYAVGLLAIRYWAGTFPMGTLLVNLSGSLLIGLLSGYLVKTSNYHWQLFLMTGVCGGFTTFSAFSLDNIRLLKDHLYLQWLLYSGGNVLGGMCLCLLGFWLTSQIWK